MDHDPERLDERSRLLGSRRLSVHSVISSHVSKDEELLRDTSVGERLPYNDYTTIDWLHDLVKSSYHYRKLRSDNSLRSKLFAAFDSSQGWVIAVFSGIITAVIAAFVDLAVDTVSDYKHGFCTTNIFSGKEFCCTKRSPLRSSRIEEECHSWHSWSHDWWTQYAVYIFAAAVMGVISGSLTMTTKRNLPATSPGQGDRGPAMRRLSQVKELQTETPVGKSMYMAAGSGIPEIKTVLSGFVIPHLFDLKVLLVKATGSIFAVSTGMCLGKEGPFVHISVCVAHQVAQLFPKFKENGRQLREVYAAGCAAGLSVAFGAPIGGVLFAYEEIATYFPRKVLWRAFICSLLAAMTLRQLDPTGSGSLVLFETRFNTEYQAYHYPVFILLGVAGGVFGGLFTRLNFAWSQWFRKYTIIKQHPVLEVLLVALVTAALQYPNMLTRDAGDKIIKNLLIDCDSDKWDNRKAYVCMKEKYSGDDYSYIGWLVYGCIIKLVLVIVTFGIKVPSGVIIPALDAGAFCGRLVGQIPFLSNSISPGIFAMVGAGAFLAGVSRMTISLAVIMFELTGELTYVVPNMIGIMVAKWIADAIEREGVYDLAQAVLGHPFLDMDVAMSLVRRQKRLAEELVPPTETMREIKVELNSTGMVSRRVLEEKLRLLKRRGLMDAGLVLVRKDTGVLMGYLAQGELEFGLADLSEGLAPDCQTRLLDFSYHPVAGSEGYIPEAEETSSHGSGTPPTDASKTYDTATTILERPASDSDSSSSKDILDLTSFVDRTPLTITATAPMEYVVEMFGKLGLRYLMVTEDVSGRLIGVIIKKRLVDLLDRLKHEG